MKVLFVSPGRSVYGSERSMLSLIDAMSLDCAVVCPGQGSLERELLRRDKTVYRMEFGKYAFWTNPLWHARFLWRFLKNIHRCNPDVIVINLDGHTALVTFAAVLAKRPLVRFCRFEFLPPRRAINRWSWRKAAIVICPSRFVRDQLVEWLGEIGGSKVHCLYDPCESFASIPPSSDHSDVQDSPLEAQAATIVCVGRIDPGKGIDVLINAVAEVRRAGVDAKLVVVGADDETAAGKAFSAKLKLLVCELGLQEFVSFLGYLSRAQTLEVVSRAEVLALSSESEAFGMVLAEAWAHGVPTVCSNRSGCAEITTASRGGVTAAAGDPSSFADRIVRLISDRKLARLAGIRGRCWVRENCDPTEYAKNVQALLYSIIDVSRSH